jgi:hypothetical protein
MLLRVLTQEPPAVRSLVVEADLFELLASQPFSVGDVYF